MCHKARLDESTVVWLWHTRYYLYLLYGRAGHWLDGPSNDGDGNGDGSLVALFKLIDARRRNQRAEHMKGVRVLCAARCNWKSVNCLPLFPSLSACAREGGKGGLPPAIDARQNEQWVSISCHVGFSNGHLWYSSALLQQWGSLNGLLIELNGLPTS